MTKIMFVCHGNICRSPMAEMIFKDIITKKGASHNFVVASSATSTDEIGNGIHHGTRHKLAEKGVTAFEHYSTQLKASDNDKYDYIVGMDSQNVDNILRIVKANPSNKVSRLLDFTSVNRDIADPWYTGDFEKTYQDVLAGCTALAEKLGL